VVVTVVNSRWFGPERAARDYLDAVTDGDLTSAARQAPAAGEGSTALLTDDVYGAAEGTASGYELGDLTEWDEDKAVLAVELEGVERGAEQELMLERDGRRWLLFDRWRVSDGGLARLVSLPRGEAEGGLTVNGVPVADDAEEFWMLPGTYRVELHARNRWVEEDAAPLVVGDELGSLFEPGEVSASAELRSTVEAELAAYLEQCMSSTEAEPEGCPQSAYPFGDVRRLSWSLVTAPTLDYSWFDGTFPVELSVDEPGTAEASYEVDQSFGFGPRDWQRETEESTLYVEATADVSGDELEVTFDSF
jgi:hypothetical protein